MGVTTRQAFVGLMVFGSACAADSPQSENESAIAHPTLAAPDQFLNVVKVLTDRGQCSGSLIATDTVLTAAHCFCHEGPSTHLPNSPNECALDATVVFRLDPHGSTDIPTKIHGTAIVNPGYDGFSVLDRNLVDDIALVRLDADAPSFAKPLDVAKFTYATHENAVIAGYGKLGSHCQKAQPLGYEELYYTVDQIDEYESDSIFVFFHRVFCDGDSGGPLLGDYGDDTVYGVVSGWTWYLFHLFGDRGFVNKMTAVAPFYDWIKANTCPKDHCSTKAEMCRCGAGLGDCETDADCEDGLHCAQGVGSTFGYPPGTNVCLPTGPPEGTCACRLSGAGSLCTTTAPMSDAYNACSASYHPVCNPQFSSPQHACGACTCTH